MAAAPTDDQRGLRRTWPQRLLISFNLALIVVCLSAAGGLGYFYYKFGQLPSIDLAKVLQPEPSPGEPQNFLLVGSDSRAFVDPGSQDERAFGNQTLAGAGGRADTIILLRVDPRAKRAAMVSFPRDLWVTVAGTNRKNRINTAFFGGPKQLIDTITLNFNVPIHHYVQVDFKGFKEVVDAVGGVVVYLPTPVRDYDPGTRRNLTGLNILDTGCVTLSGDQALAYVRSRHFQFQENGRWKTDPSGDLGRIKRQQDFIRRALREALSRGLLNPGRLNRLVNAGVDNVERSSSLDIQDVVELGRHFRSLSPDVLQQYQLPVSNTRHGAASTVDILARDRAKAEEILNVFRGVVPDEPPATPSAVSIRVLNGSGRPGEAGEATTALHNVQFATTEPGDSSRKLARTVVRYGPGQEAKARLVESYLKAGGTIESQPDLRGVDVVLVTGADFAGILATPRAVVPGATTTTAAPQQQAPPAPGC